jgi:hypothetical protein
MTSIKSFIKIVQMVKGGTHRHNIISPTFLRIAG